MKNILFPTDFSDNSTHALDFALRLAKKSSANLILFNSYEMPPARMSLMASFVDKLKEDSIKQLEKIRHKISSNEENKALSIKVESMMGDFVPLIPEVVEMHQVDFLVMGAKGATGILNRLVGSNTLEVIQNTSCPVLAVPENAAFGMINKIAYATDLRKLPHPDRLEPLFELARLFNSSVEFVNIIREEDESLADERTEQANILSEMAGDIPTSMYFATDNNIIKGLGEYVIHHQPGMFAMLSRKHTLFERIFKNSTTSKLTYQTKIPLLVMDE